MKALPDGSVDLILADLPYGTTELSWDSIIPLEALWAEYWRVLKPKNAVVLFGCEPFSSLLRMSQIKAYRYDFVWVKNGVTGFPNAKHRPLKQSERISVFSKGLARPNAGDKAMPYNPQGLTTIQKTVKNSNVERSTWCTRPNHRPPSYTQTQTGYPRDVLFYNRETGLHPTQKPVLLLEYLIKTYSSQSEVVLDNCMGSGSAGVAAHNTGRSFVGIEQDETYFKLASDRIRENHLRRSA